MIYQNYPPGQDPVALFKHLGLLNQDAPCALFMTKDECLIMSKAAVRIALEKQTITFTPLSALGHTLLANHPKSVSYLPLTNQHLTDAERIRHASVLDPLRTFLKTITFDTHLPEDAKRLLGTFSFDLIDYFESLPTPAADPLDYPDYEFFLPEELIRVPKPSLPDQLLLEQHPTVFVKKNVSDETYCKQVEALKEHILSGDIFQCVLARRFSLPCHDPFAAFEKLILSNPSPYQFYFKGLHHTVFGSSPETCVKVENQKITLHPIAGTRPRGYMNGQLDLELDQRYETDLKLDPKEIAEHMMLVDLARNDVARVSQTGHRQLQDLLQIEKFSRVMHLVSRVTGQLEPDLDGLQAYAACLNMGTLSGAPKIEATKLLRTYENEKRGPYGGGIGWIGQNGDMDTAIIIRSACVKDQIAHVSAGAGIVIDSIPEMEAHETLIKASAVIQAIASTEDLLS